LKKSDRITGAPAHLSREARALWKKLVTEYVITDEGGLAILKSGLESYDRATSARKQIDREGLTFRDRFGASKPHPLIACERDARAQWLSALKLLNLDCEPAKPGLGGR